ncbi:tyrosine-type recombinase/integrase [Actinospica robiniae]|uniref:tyrosine-type recombinase/integrase n=1 Tax=Actinospica robiniae TaxID=304901 RepID=UPI000429D740|nr:tyrosine-type recombinase/integrase [Actinospica robiniae]
MGRVKMRTDSDHCERYTAYYNDGDTEKSAGTFNVRREAERAWRRRERQLQQERRTRQSAGRRSITEYAATWFPAYVCEATTRQSYAFWLERYVLPTFGHHRLDRLTPATVRTTLAKLGKAGASRDILEAVRCVLGALYTTAVTDQLVTFHPCHGVKMPPEVRPSLAVLSPEELDLVLSLIDDPVAALVVECAIESGCRWGELAELRVRDLDTATGILSITRTVVQLLRRFHPTGGRFLIKAYPKNRRHRRMRLRPAFVAKLAADIDRRHLGRDDLLFPSPGRGQRREPAARTTPTGDEYTEPNDHGRRYRHGTQAGYGLGQCRCPACRAAVADYRAGSRARGLDRPRTTLTPPTPERHMDRNWFRSRRWQPALRAAGINRKITFHDLRHAHASWLLHGRASLQIVSERLGHSSLQPTLRYLHTLPNPDDTALKALDLVRPSHTTRTAFRRATNSRANTRALRRTMRLSRVRKGTWPGTTPAAHTA